MTQIYATARRVVVWLGEADDNISRCLKVLTRGYQAATAQDSRSASSESMYLTQEEKKFITQLIDRPYFDRTWVLQETMVAKTVLVRWSYLEMPFETLIAACEIFHLAESRWSHFNVACSKSTTFGRLRRAFRDLTPDRSSLGLTQLLMHTRENKASDPRDKVFTLFGIANQGYGKTPVCPDYSRTVTEVHSDVAKFLIDDDHSLQILSAVQHAYANSALPSWVPDWAVAHPIRLLDAVQEYLNFRIHGESLTYPLITHIPHPRKLALGGFSFDTICKVHNIRLALDVVDEGDRMLLHSLHDRRTIANATGHNELYSPTQEDVEVVWLRTISAGLSPDVAQQETVFARARYPQCVRWCSIDNTSNVPPKEVVDEIFLFRSLMDEGKRDLCHTERVFGSWAA